MIKFASSGDIVIFGTILFAAIGVYIGKQKRLWTRRRIWYFSSLSMILMGFTTVIIFSLENDKNPLFGFAALLFCTPFFLAGCYFFAWLAWKEPWRSFFLKEEGSGKKER